MVEQVIKQSPAFSTFTDREIYASLRKFSKIYVKIGLALIVFQFEGNLKNLNLFIINLLKSRVIFFLNCNSSDLNYYNKTLSKF